MSDWTAEVTHLITRNAPAPSAKIFYALVNASRIVKVEWIASVVGILAHLKATKSIASCLYNVDSFLPNLERLENTIMKAASASQLQVQGRS